LVIEQFKINFRIIKQRPPKRKLLLTESGSWISPAFVAETETAIGEKHEKVWEPAESLSSLAISKEMDSVGGSSGGVVI
jgi:hypothetical protein